MNTGKAICHSGRQDGALSEPFPGESLMGEGYAVGSTLESHGMDAGELPDTHSGDVRIHAHILLNHSRQ